MDSLDKAPFPGPNVRRHSSSRLLKFWDRPYLEKFRAGKMYLSEQARYNELENDLLRTDPFENVDVIAQPNQIRSLRITDEKTGQVIELRPHGPWRINRGIRAYNVFCMYSIPTTIRGSPHVDPRNFGFGDSFTVVLDSQKFLDRVQKGANAAGFALDCNLVEYYDADAYIGDVGPFHKSSDFEFQREFRIIITPGMVGSVVLNLGSLEDITSPIWPLAEINQLIEFTLLRD
jgi:hypothetical protein